MRVFISCDMEGCTGIVHNDQLIPGGYDYQRGRRLMTGDVVAAVEAALAYEDVEYVRVCDGHGTMRNILIEELPSGCDLVSGPAGSRVFCQSEGLDDSFDVVLFVGYHARAGTPEAVLPHTWIGSVVREIRVNGVVFGEAALNAAIAGEHGVPVAFLSGDVAACAEAKSQLGDDLVTVAVKRAFGAKSAVCRPPAETADEIRLGVLTALETASSRKPFRVEGPVEFAATFHRKEQADLAERRTGVERKGPSTLATSAGTYLEAVRAGWALLESAAGDPPEWLR